MANYVLITAANNEEAFIERTCESVVVQTVRPPKWIVVDDASVDGTASIVACYREAHPDLIQLLHVEWSPGRDFRNKVRAFDVALARVRQLDFSPYWQPRCRYIASAGLLRDDAVARRSEPDARHVSYFDRYMRDVEEPVGHEAAPAFYFVSKLASDHVKVALTVQGADEPWAGYGRYVGVKLSTFYSRLPIALTQTLACVISRTPFPSERLKRGAISLGERDLEMKSQLYIDTLRNDLLAAPWAPVDSIRHLEREVAHLDPLTQILYIDTRTNLPDDLLMVGDKTSKANSIEVRVPFLDRRLVELHSHKIGPIVSSEPRCGHIPSSVPVSSLWCSVEDAG